ncbi:hypothetical protein C8R43DRAFT_827248, partial [Mycena crocata]
GTVWVAKALGKVQRLVCKVITGALRTTATDLLDLHANILPVHIRLNRTTFNAAARLCSLPPSHPLHRVVARCKHVPRFHRSPIHHTLHAFPSLCAAFEVIHPHLQFPPVPPGSFTTEIAHDKDRAGVDAAAAVQRGGACIFTDGSGYEGGVGAAAV